MCVCTGVSTCPSVCVQVLVCMCLNLCVCELTLGATLEMDSRWTVEKSVPRPIQYCSLANPKTQDTPCLILTLTV